MIRAGQVNAQDVDNRWRLVHNTRILPVGDQRCATGEAAWHRSTSSGQDTRVALTRRAEAI